MTRATERPSGEWARPPVPDAVGPKKTARVRSAPLLGLIATLLAVGALKVTSPVTLPLAFAVLLLALTWPLQTVLERHLPRGISLALGILVLIGVMTGLVFSFVVALNMVAEKAPDYGPALEEGYDRVTTWAAKNGMFFEPTRTEVREALGRLLGIFGRGLQSIYALGGMMFLAFIFLILGLIEIPNFQAKLELAPAGSPRAKLLTAARTIGRRYRQFMVTKTITSLLTGGLTWLFLWSFGLDLAFVWGFLAFLLNFIPAVGSVVAVIPPVCLAFLQFRDFWAGVGVLLGLTAIQMVIGNYLDPRLQGRNLKLSSFVVVLSIVFWGWVWGVPGALLGVPMTVGVLAICRHFERTEWLAELLADIPANGASVATEVEGDAEPRAERPTESSMRRPPGSAG